MTEGKKLFYLVEVETKSALGLLFSIPAKKVEITPEELSHIKELCIEDTEFNREIMESEPCGRCQALLRKLESFSNECLSSQSEERNSKETM